MRSSLASESRLVQRCKLLGRCFYLFLTETSLQRMKETRGKSLSYRDDVVSDFSGFLCELSRPAIKLFTPPLSRAQCLADLRRRAFYYSRARAKIHGATRRDVEISPRLLAPRDLSYPGISKCLHSQHSKFHGRHLLRLQ